MISLPLDKAVFGAWLPHAGDMILLDTLLAWSETEAHCTTLSHTRSPHPLAVNGRLGSANLVEYAAQAMALHGAMSAATADKAVDADNANTPDNTADAGNGHGVLAGVRRLSLYVNEIHTETAALDIAVQLVSGDARTALYDFTVQTQNRLLAEGRATVMFVTSPH